jgi:hypothetical protein
MAEPCHVSRVVSYCLRGTAGAPGALLFTGEALRQNADESSSSVLLSGSASTTSPSSAAASPTFMVIPHGTGAMELLVARPKTHVKPAPGARNRAASTISDDDDPLDTMVGVTYRGAFVHGKRQGWGTLSRCVLSGEVWVTRTIKCSWQQDVPQLLSDPCTIVEEEEKATVGTSPSSGGSKRVTMIYSGLAMAVHDSTASAPSPALSTSSRTRAATAVSPTLDKKPSPSPTVGGFSNGLSWAQTTRFLPDALGERIDMQAGSRYCGEFQCGLRHGFGVITSLASHSLLYVGMFDNDMRHGAGTSVDEDREMVFDGVWADDGIAAAGGTLHLPPPASLAVQGQKWASATSVASGFLVNVRNAHTGMWEPLLVQLDEALPSLISSLESLGATLSGDPSQSAVSPLLSPARPSGSIAQGSAVLAASPVSEAALQWERQVAIDLSRFEPLHDTSTAATREMNRVRITACHAMTLGVTRRALAAFQRCMLFLYGSCGPRPVVEVGAGASPDAPGTAATSWCRLVATGVHGFTCSHRTRGGTPISVDLLNRAVQAASSIVMSFRLRLMMCHGAAAQTPPTPMMTPQREARFTGTGGDSSRAAYGSPGGAELFAAHDADESEMTRAAGASDPSEVASCCQCAVHAYAHAAANAPPEVDDAALSQALRFGGFDHVGASVAAVLSGLPHCSSGAKLVNTTWDVVMSSAAPLLLSLSEVTFAEQAGKYVTALKRVTIAAAQAACRAAHNPDTNMVEHMASRLLLGESELSAAEEQVRALGLDRFHQQLRSLATTIAELDVSSAPTGRQGDTLLEALLPTLRAVAAKLLRDPFRSSTRSAECFKVDTTDVGPLFAYTMWPLNQGRTSPVAPGAMNSPGSPRTSYSAASLVGKAGTKEGVVSARVECLTRLAVFCRAVALLMATGGLRKSSKGAATATRLSTGLLHLMLYLGTARDPSIVHWLHVLLRVTSPPNSLGVVASFDAGSGCGHDALANIVNIGSSEGSSGRNFEPKHITVGSLPSGKTSAVATVDLSGLGAWSVQQVAVAVVENISGTYSLAGRNPAGRQATLQLEKRLNAFFEDHLCVPASVLASGCATGAAAGTVDDGARGPDESVFLVVPSAKQTLDDIRGASSLQEDFLSGKRNSAAARFQGQSFEVEDPVLLAVTDWTLQVVGDQSISSCGPATRLFPLRMAQSQRMDRDQDSDGEAPNPDATPSPKVHDELDAAPHGIAATIEYAMKRCYSGREPELRALRLAPLVELLRHIGLRMSIVERSEGSDRSASGDFGSPGVINVDPFSALHLRIDVDPDTTEGIAEGPWLRPREGALRVQALVLERMLDHWRQLRRRVEVPSAT